MLFLRCCVLRKLPQRRMRCCLGKNKSAHLIFGPDTFDNERNTLPIDWSNNDKIWETDMNELINAIINNNYNGDTIKDKNLILLIFSFIKYDIYESLKYPKQYIIHLAINSTPSLQPLNIPILSQHSKQEFLCIQEEKRKSYSIFEESMINDIIKINKFSSLQTKFDQIYIKDHKFHEIVVYEPGGFFTKHTDTMIECDNKLYDYTLIIIPPNDYEGGELVIYDKENDIQVSCDKFEWKWIVLHKELEHECKIIRKGYKIIIKFHIALYQGDELEEYLYDLDFGFGAELDVGDVTFNPMATGVPT